MIGIYAPGYSADAWRLLLAHPTLNVRGGELGAASKAEAATWKASSQGSASASENLVESAKTCRPMPVSFAGAQRTRPVHETS